MSTTSNQNKIEQGEENLNIKDFLFMCLAKWHWFVLSLMLTLSFATLRIMKTPPTYTRSSQVMIKPESTNIGGMANAMNAFADMGLTMYSWVENELVAIKSPSIMEEVVKRLNLDMNYSVDGLFYNRTLFKYCRR